MAGKSIADWAVWRRERGELDEQSANEVAEILGLGQQGGKGPKLEREARKVVELYNLTSRVVTWEEPDGEKTVTRRKETQFSVTDAIAALPLFRSRDPLWTLQHVVTLHSLVVGAPFSFELPEWLSKRRGGDKPDWWRRRLKRLGGHAL